jgi:hypothetical protein
MLMIVDKPMGTVPINIDCTGWTIMAPKISGYRVYRKTLMIHPVTKRRTLIAKMTTEIQYNHWALYGSVFKRIDTMPVPIVTENHLFVVSFCFIWWVEATYEGVKLRMILLQPTSCFVSWVCVCGFVLVQLIMLLDIERDSCWIWRSWRWIEVRSLLPTLWGTETQSAIPDSQSAKNAVYSTKPDYKAAKVKAQHPFIFYWDRLYTARFALRRLHQLTESSSVSRYTEKSIRPKQIQRFIRQPSNRCRNSSVISKTVIDWQLKETRDVRCIDFSWSVISYV